MATIVSLIKIICVMAASITLGNWFITEFKAIRKKGEPIYKAYLTPPGLLVLAAIFFPVLLWLIDRLK